MVGAARSPDIAHITHHALVVHCTLHPPQALIRTGADLSPPWQGTLLMDELSSSQCEAIIELLSRWVVVISWLSRGG